MSTSVKKWIVLISSLLFTATTSASDEPPLSLTVVPVFQLADIAHDTGHVSFKIRVEPHRDNVQLQLSWTRCQMLWDDLDQEFRPFCSLDGDVVYRSWWQELQGIYSPRLYYYDWNLPPGHYLVQVALIRTPHYVAFQKEQPFTIIEGR